MRWQSVMSQALTMPSGGRRDKFCGGILMFLKKLLK
ncbi:uncharacterized protein METZ01_LOCUS233618 [marine metagenome]|uniref:Uncharacterized protein n=1 Tax=marine metagenome TaxID=408172 RepID=A0A382H0M3_9ZZZZ